MRSCAGRKPTIGGRDGGGAAAGRGDGLTASCPVGNCTTWRALRWSLISSPVWSTCRSPRGRNSAAEVRKRVPGLREWHHTHCSTCSNAVAHQRTSQCQPPSPTDRFTTACWPIRDAFVLLLPAIVTTCTGGGYHVRCAYLSTAPLPIAAGVSKCGVRTIEGSKDCRDISPVNRLTVC